MNWIRDSVWLARFKLWTGREWRLWLKSKFVKPACYCDLHHEPVWGKRCEICPGAEQ